MARNEATMAMVYTASLTEKDYIKGSQPRFENTHSRIT